MITQAVPVHGYCTGFETEDIGRYRINRTICCLQETPIKKWPNKAKVKMKEWSKP